jgi:hypothetical protein
MILSNQNFLLSMFADLPRLILFANSGKFLFEKVWENDRRKMTSRTQKTSNVAFQTLRFEKVQ